MKKKLLFLALASTLLLAGCGGNENTDADKIESFSTENVDDNIYEWVSPDGVHYWVFDGYRRRSVVPRYDANGELVVGRSDLDE